ncbi:MAG: type II toxin-antitoxin system RelE/ParE family toxin [Capnocytophaga sp.]|nr:type II toxin-antitoxin system RelE/ParE family toxin [Capnocytophaga sp.]
MWNVRWSYSAELQYTNVLTFWIKHNLSNTYSQKIVTAVEEAEDILTENPYIFEEKEDYKNGVLFKYRKLIILNNFSLIYIIRESVEIVAFWDNRQDPDKLKELL